MILSWTNNTTAEAWERKIAGLTGPQGKVLAQIFAHLLMFSNVRVCAAYVKGKENPIPDYLFCLHDQDNFSQFQYESLVTQYPWLKQCHCFLPSQELAALTGLFCAVNGACDNSQCEDTARMDRSRLKFYQDNFCQQHGIDDPCLLQILSHCNASLIFACYTAFLALGHTLWCKTIKSATIANYLSTATNHIWMLVIDYLT
jgi:hypothetical protein